MTLAILGSDADAEERAVLGAILYNKNDVVLHTGAARCCAQGFGGWGRNVGK